MFNFNLDVFKAGKPAIDRFGGEWIYDSVASEKVNTSLINHYLLAKNVSTGKVERFTMSGKKYITINHHKNDLVSIDTNSKGFDNSFAWQVKCGSHTNWIDLDIGTEPSWIDDYSYRIHPLSDFIMKTVRK